MPFFFFHLNIKILLLSTGSLMTQFSLKTETASWLMPKLASFHMTYSVSYLSCLLVGLCVTLLAVRCYEGAALCLIWCAHHSYKRARLKFAKGQIWLVGLEFNPFAFKTEALKFFCFFSGTPLFRSQKCSHLTNFHTLLIKFYLNCELTFACLISFTSL